MKSSSRSTKKQKISGKGSSRDRLSELPDEVLVHILSLMPTLDAVRTVILRPFGNLWTKVHSLSFSDDHPSFVYNADGTTREDAESFFTEFVSNVLVLHSRPSIDNFHLVGYCLKEAWVLFALSRQVQKLTISRGTYWDFDHDLIIPGYVFVNQSIVSLQIVDCEIKQLSRVHMGSLRQLTLKNPTQDVVENLNVIISGCLSLERLHISYLDNLSIVSSSLKWFKVKYSSIRTLECPNLELLHIYDHNLRDVEKINVPSQCEVIVDCCGLCKVSPDMPDSMVRVVGNAQVFKLPTFTVELLAYCSIKKLAFPDNIRRKHFVLEFRNHEGSILGICRLLRDSLCSEELTIYGRQVEECLATRSHKFGTKLETVSNMLVQELSLPCVLPNLKTVTFHGFEKPHQVHLLQLADFILKSAVNLEKLQFV